MKINRISVFHRNLPLTHPYWLSGKQLRFDRLDATFVKLETEDGATGWGEGTPWGHSYVPAHGPGIRAGLETLATAILGQDPRQVGIVEQAMDQCLPGHLYAKAPVDMACWDIAGQSAGLSIADMLGGRHPNGTAVASSVSSGTVDDVIAEIERFRSMGYVSHSVKIGNGVAEDIACIRAVRSIRQAGEWFLFDVNRAWSRRQAVQVMTAIAEPDIAIEQPCESLDDIAAIRPLTTVPISVDESLVTLQDAARIARDGIAEIFGIKLNRVGGLSKAARIRDVALAHGIDCTIMATGGTVLADAEAAHLAQTIPARHRLSVWACQDMITVDPAPGRGPRNANGYLTVSDAPGLGFAPDEEHLGEPVAVYERVSTKGKVRR
ncbi:MAG: mandelate racemase [Paracoccaceae bacterium]|nr:mandelate racemase [Paracoccaceae bacterium]